MTTRAPLMLIGRYRSPYVRRVAVAMHALGLPFERTVLSPLTDPDAVRAFNPIGRVPVLILEDGERLIDSGAILDHVQEVAPLGVRILAPGGVERRRALRIAAAMTNALEKAIQAFYEVAKRPPELVHEPYRTQLREQCRAGLDMVEAEARLMAGPWLVGDGCTLADITAAVGWSFLRDFAPDLAPTDRHPALAAHAMRCETLPCFLACPQEPLAAATP